MLSGFAHSRKMVSKNTFDTLLTCWHYSGT